MILCNHERLLFELGNQIWTQGLKPCPYLVKQSNFEKQGLVDSSWIIWTLILMLGDSNIHTYMYRCVCGVCMKIYHCLSVCMYMCVPILVHVLVYVCICLYSCTSVCIYVYVSSCHCTSVCLYACVCIYTMCVFPSLH